MAATPCRLFVIMAREADVAVVIRRGSSRWYQLIRWDMQRDEFTDGAWFKGRIYENRCDLSPDGELFVYFCHGGRVRPGYTDSWTAVSRPPWLYALALWPMGTTYGGGGRFSANRVLHLRNGCYDTPHPDHLPHGLVVTEGPRPLHASLDEIEDADYCGRDRRGRLVFARAGKLFRRQGGRDRDRELADFNGRTPLPVPAPAWARRPIAYPPKLPPKPARRARRGRGLPSGQ